MKPWISLFLLCAALLDTRADHEGWLTDFGAAKKQAKTENKRMLLLFTGSDWCPNCQHWQKNVFTKPEFLEFAKTNLVLMVVDFPERRKLPKALERKNEALKDKFNVGEYPAAHILDSNGKQLGVIKWDEAGLEPFFKKLSELPGASGK